MARSVALPLTWKTRVVLPPLTVNLFAFGPSIVRSSVTLSSLARVMVPLSPPANLMTSAPAPALAAVIAARSEPSPPSARFVTVNVLGKARPSRASSRGRNRWRSAALPLGPLSRAADGIPSQGQSNMVGLLHNRAWGRMTRPAVLARRPSAGRGLAGEGGASQPGLTGRVGFRGVSRVALSPGAVAGSRPGRVHSDGWGRVIVVIR